MIVIAPDHVTHLYVSRNDRLSGAVKMYYFDLYGMWSGPGSLTMRTKVAAAGSYEMALSCSALADGVKVRIEVGSQAKTLTVNKTAGVWRDPEHAEYNFERVGLRGSVDLKAGPTTIGVSVTGPKKLRDRAFNLAAIELTPVAAKKAIAAEEAAGMKYRGDSQWFSDCGYGLMFHWGAGRTLKDGWPKTYKQAVREFDTKRWAAMCDSFGAKYVMITANHGLPHMPAPLPNWEKVHPGWTTKRDLLADMHEALDKRGIRFGVYLNCPTYGRLGKQRSVKSYFNAVAPMFDEIGTRYGERLCAYWLDSWYQPYVRWGHFPMARMLAHTKAGYKDRMVAFNHWAFPVPSKCQDYWCAEVYQSLARPPRTRIFKGTAGDGLLYHGLYSPDCHWGAPKIEKGKIIEKPIWTAEVYARYLTQCMRKGGVVTVNLGSFADGSVSPYAARWMRKVCKIARG